MESLWSQLMAALANEFSDIADMADFVRITVRLSLAAIFGALLGIERETKGKAAGVRTHMLVAVSCALFVLIPQMSGTTNADITRVIQGVIAGVGFLGAGAIIKGRDDESVRGLTTAAGIFMTAGIGIAAGLGREATALLSTLLALLIFSIAPIIVRWFEKK
ncbi:MAG: MgtC/SapB family protein [Rhizobacter sp.]|nr:MgtC/SapB family protein [Burkholderiales bacterium]